MLNKLLTVSLVLVSIVGIYYFIEDVRRGKITLSKPEVFDKWFERK